MEVKKICSALVLGATLLTLQGASMQAFAADASHTPGTPQNAARLKEDARIANASRINRAHIQGQHDAMERSKQRIATQRNDARLQEDAKVANASRIARAHERGRQVEVERSKQRIATERNNTRLQEDAKIANASRIARARERGAEDAKKRPHAH